MKRKLLITLIVALAITSSSAPVQAKEDYATLVFPVRGRQYWRADTDISNLQILKETVGQQQVPATWLLQYDALSENETVDVLRRDSSDQELGLFLEVTYNLAKDSYVNYLWETERWERADKVFLSGYGILDRQKLIDHAFEKFYQQFGYYPKSVGAWHIDAWSLRYLHFKYGVQTAVICADQYLTDGYQIWGQYWGTPYYPSIRNTLEPAFFPQDKIDLLKIQWAMRDPVSGYGLGSEFSNHSTQVNDYARSLKLPESHFPHLLDEYFKQTEAPIKQVTLGIEAGEVDPLYLPELKRQLQLLAEKQIQPVTMSQFAAIFKQVSGGRNIFAKIVGSDHDTTVTWYNTPLFRLAVRTNAEQSKIIDLRTYSTDRLWSTEYWFRDAKQNLIRLLPAVIDEVGIGRELPIQPDTLRVTDTSLEFDVPDLSQAKNALRNCPCTQSYQGSTVKLTFHPRSAWSIQPGAEIFGLSQLLLRLVPDVRVSKINGKLVGGIQLNPETLLGVDLAQTKVGIIHYGYPILEAFKNTRQALSLNSWQFGQDQEQFLPYLLKGVEFQVKDVPYGTGQLRQLYKTRPTYENSMFAIFARGK